MKPVYAGVPTPPVNPPDAARTRATAMRHARRIRARSLRRRVVAGALALFVAAWLLIAVALVSGHDPALASKPAATVASAPASTTSTTTTPSSTSATTTSGKPSSTSASSNGTTGASSVSTHQS